MKKVDVKLKSNPYKILIGDNIFFGLNEFVKKYKLNKNVLAVIDKNIYTLYKKEIKAAFAQPLGKFTYLTIESKETQKTVTSLKKIYSSLVLSNYGRDTLIIAIGGGIVGDVAGFAAATYARGVQYIQIPTTLLAAVDSSVGGKTGINFGSTKNIVGAFYQPELVLIDINFLKSLPKREIISGVGEILKYAFLINGDFFQYFEKNLNKLIELDKKVLTKVITESVNYKASVVVKDEKEETGIRKLLNLGHTFAHAIEIERNHKLKHGEAVIAGLACALYLSNRLGVLKNSNLVNGLRLLKNLSGFIKINKYNEKKILDLMKRDKKSLNEKYKFVLMKDFGKILVDVDAENEDVIWAIKQGINLFNKQ